MSLTILIFGNCGGGGDDSFVESKCHSRKWWNISATAATFATSPTASTPPFASATAIAS